MVLSRWVQELVLIAAATEAMVRMKSGYVVVGLRKQIGGMLNDALNMPVLPSRARKAIHMAVLVRAPIGFPRHRHSRMLCSIVDHTNLNNIGHNT